MMLSDLPAVRLNDLLTTARARNASDVHVAPDEPPMLRVDGTVFRLPWPPLATEDIVRFTEALLPARGVDMLRTRGDADAAYHEDALGRFRVHAFRAGGAVRIAIRLLACEVPPLDALGLPVVLRQVAERTGGLILFVGPTGSGKSTALAALVDHVNRTATRHIMTIEDPVEYVHRSVRSLVAHRELGSDVSGYSAAVHAALRCDPDVLLIGELREPTTMRAALRAAETGHLVLSTLHAGGASQAVDRIVDAFPATSQGEIRTQVAQTLAAIVSIRLVRRSPGPGRHAAAEVLVGSDAVRSLIREGKSHQLRNAIATGRAAGMQTLETHLSELVVRRCISLDDARLASERPDEIRALADVS